MITRTPTQIKHREAGVKRIRHFSTEAYLISLCFPLYFTDNRGSIFNTLDKVKTYENVTTEIR